jgi:hypothetical protein
LSRVAPFAEYALTAAPAWLEYEFPDGAPAVLTASSGLLVSRRDGDGIFIRGDERLFALGWGGTRNHSVSFLELGPQRATRIARSPSGAVSVSGEGPAVWAVSHLGHHSWLEVNGVRWHGGGPRPLASGDRVSPATGLEFTFTLRPDLEPLAEELAALRWAPAGDGRVLADWVMERTGFDAAAAELACRHLATRR